LRNRKLASAIGWRAMTVLTFALAGVVAALLDAYFLPTLYHKVHLLIGAASLLLLCIAAQYAHGRWERQCAWFSMVTCGAMAGFVLVANLRSFEMTHAVLREPNAARRALVLIR